MLASSRKGIPFVIAAVFLMSLQDALFKLVSGDIVLWQVWALVKNARNAAARGWAA